MGTTDNPNVLELLTTGWRLFEGPDNNRTIDLANGRSKGLLDDWDGRPQEKGCERNGIGEIEIDLRGHQVYWKGKVLRVSETEMKLLAALCEEPGRAWTFEDLAAKVWGSYYGDRGHVHSAIKRLRHKLNLANVQLRIESVRGFGYRTSEMGPEANPARE